MLFTIQLDTAEQKQCRDFAEESAKTQRENRSGGTLIRQLGEIQENTHRGKVAEVVAKKFFEQEPLLLQRIEIDFNIYPRGKWDETDFEINGKKISVKSAKWFSKWLLLESKDINRGDLYDYYIFITVDKKFTSGTIKGWASQQEILDDKKTLKLKKGEPIPGTHTPLDADNYGRHSDNLHCTEEDFVRLAEILKGQNHI